jgi:hypothetical protein
VTERYNRDVTTLNKREGAYPQAVCGRVSGVPRILGKQGQRRHYPDPVFACSGQFRAAILRRQLNHVFVCTYLRWECLLHLGTSSNSLYLWSQPGIRKFSEFRSVH